MTSTRSTPAPVDRVRPATPPPRPTRTGAGVRAALPRIVALIVLVVLDVVLLGSIRRFFDEGVWFLGVAIIVVLAGAHVVVLAKRLLAFRWLAPGLALLVLFTLAPIAYTGYLAFTNASSDHQLTESQAVTSLETDTYLAPDAPTYRWAAYQNAQGYALWLIAGRNQALLATPGEDPVSVRAGTNGYGPADADGFPTSIPGYTRISRVASVARIDQLSALSFGAPSHPIRISGLDSAGPYQQRYTYDSGADAVTDHKTGTVYTAHDGTFTASNGTTITPSFQAPIGFGNFTKLFGNKLIRIPAIRIFIWTIVYAIVVVFLQFVLGLGLALALNDTAIPRRLAKVLRSILLLPYIVPAYLTILVWAGLLDQQLGVIPRWLHDLFGLDPSWVNSPTGAKLAVILVTVWLGLPYFLLITSGALQAIPAELYEAAEVDGASAVSRFRLVVFPLLMRMIGPLIVLGLAFNFNNFLVVYLLKSGGPPMADAQVPAGNTDLLISFTYRLSFDFGQGADYGLAAVMTMIIFAVLVPVVVSQFRYYQVWSEEA